MWVFVIIGCAILLAVGQIADTIVKRNQMSFQPEEIDEPKSDAEEIYKETFTQDIYNDRHNPPNL